MRRCRSDCPWRPCLPTVFGTAVRYRYPITNGHARPGWTVHTVRRRGRKINWHDPNDIDHEAALIKVQEQVRELIAAMEFARTHGAGPGRRDLVLGEERP